MKVVSLISTLFWLFSGLAWALPMASSLEDGDLEDMMMQIIDSNSEAYELYDFIDDCRTEGITINDLYEKIAEALNDEGFFKKKMTT